MENVKELASDCALSQWGNNVFVITVVGGLPKGHAHKQIKVSWSQDREQLGKTCLPGFVGAIMGEEVEKHGSGAISLTVLTLGC